MNITEIVEKLYENKKYDEIIELSKFNPDLDVQFYTGLSFQTQGDLEKALLIWHKILEKDPYHERTIRALAWGSKDSLEKLFYLEKLAYLDLSDSEDLSFMASLYLDSNRYQDAHHWYQKALSLNKENALATLGLADLHARLALHYLQDTEDLKEINLSDQMSDDASSEDILRFIYDYIVSKDLCNIP